MEIKRKSNDIRSYSKCPFSSFTRIENEETHKAWCKVFVLCNIAPNVIKHPAFKEALLKTRPNYVAPSANCLKSTYLDALLSEDDGLISQVL